MSGKKRILAFLIGFFVFFYVCWAVCMSIYTESMPVVKVKSAIKTALTFQGTIVSHYHQAREEQAFLSPFDAVVEKVYLASGQDVGVGKTVLKFSTDGLSQQLDQMELLLGAGSEENFDALSERYRLLKQAVAGSGELTAQTAWKNVTALVSPGDRVTAGTPLFSGTTATGRAYLSWDMSANDAIYFERGTPFGGVKLTVLQEKKTVEQKFDLTVTSKTYDPGTNRYIYQIALPEDVSFSFVDGTAIAFSGVSEGRQEHGGVIPLSAVTFDESMVTFFVLKERERVWGTEYYVEECRSAAEEVAGGQVALTFFPNGGQVIYETSKPLESGMAVRVEK